MGVRVHLRHVDGETGHTYADMINKSTVKNFTMNNDVKVHAQGSRDEEPIKPKEKCNIDYNLCINKPSINGHTLIGNIKSEELGLIGKINGYAEISKVKDYLYETYYNALDYDFAKQYFLKTKAKLGIGGCSAVRNGNWYGRNLDWTYDENAEFIVRVPRLNNRYASLGMAGNIENATMDFIDSGVYSDIYKIIPFKLLDGINEKGVIINTNVVPTDKGATTESIPTLEKLDTICTSMLPRYVLDHFATAKDAADFIQQHLSLYPPKTLTQQKYEVHWIIADINETYLLEIINNVVVVTNMTENSNSVLAGKPYMTNFYLSDIALNGDGTVYTPGTQDSEHDAIKTNLITPNGAGLERYNIIVNNYENADTKAGMRELMNLLTYTNTYKEETNPTWHTEYVGLNNLTCVSTPEQFAPVEELVRKIYRERKRDGLTWQTTHSSIYDFIHRKLYLIVQEDNEEIEIEYNILDPGEAPDAVDYRTLSNRPSINNIELNGNLSTADLNIEIPVWEKGTGINSIQTKNTGSLANADNAVAEGHNTVANAIKSHTEGYATKTLSQEGENPDLYRSSHAEGDLTNAKGMGAHAEGAGTGAYADAAHAEGMDTFAAGEGSHAEGQATNTSNPAEHAEGRYNKSNQTSNIFGDAGNTLHSIGIGNRVGTGMPTLKNAFEIMQNGDAYMVGIGEYDGTNPGEAITIQNIINNKQNNIEDLIPTEASAENKLVDKAYVDDIIGDVESLLHELDSGGGVE